MKTYPIIGKNGKVEQFTPKPPPPKRDNLQTDASGNQPPQGNPPSTS